VSLSHIMKGMGDLAYRLYLRKYFNSGITREYLRNEPGRLPVALISYHYLLHIATSIHNTGPAWATWQYPMERLCGMLLPLVHSRLHPYTNLRNQITMWTQFSHLQYDTEINQKLFGNSSEEAPNYLESRVFTIEGAEEELYSPSHQHFINQIELRCLRAYYATELNRHANQLGVSFFVILIGKKLLIYNKLFLANHQFY